MGKRKRTADKNKVPPPSDLIPHAPQVDLQAELRSSDQAESSASRSLPSIMDARDSSLKRPPANQLTLNQNHGSSRAILLRHSRHHVGRHYSRRGFTNHFDASPSNWKGSPVYDAQISAKLESKDLMHSPYRESRDRIFQKQERIRSSPVAHNALSGDMRKMECRICHKRLRKNPIIIDNPISPTDLSVVAVLVCGHTYHADCLEQKTNDEDKQDPPCPLCVRTLG